VVTLTKIERALANDENVRANDHKDRYNSPLANMSDKNSKPSRLKVPLP